MSAWLALLAAAVLWTPAGIASPDYESSPAFTPDGREMFFMRADKRFRNYRLLHTRCEAGRWTPPVSPSFALPAPVLEADPSISADGKRLYFVSNRSRSEDDLDIFVVERLPGGTWGAASRLPAPVNSPASELLPREDAQGRLWFGSSRPDGHGLGDLYVATPQAGGGWRVENAGPPLSTPHFEYEVDVSRDGRSAVVVADRGDRSHLYRYVRGADGRWVERGRVPARAEVFQVGPLLSPDGKRLLYAQAEGERSGELMLVDLEPGADPSWPPRCGD